MASFFNQKEEVLSVELTKYGRKRLGLGFFQPSYCSFFDDSVIYDMSYSGQNNEDTNLIQDRILYNSFTIKSLNNSDDILAEPIGTSDLINDYAPSWDINLLNGSFVLNAASSSYYKKIFSFDDIEYTISIQNADSILAKDLNIINVSLENENSLFVEQDYILLEINEKNVKGDTKNFELEIVTFDELSGGSDGQLEKKLKFLTRQSNIINDIIFDETELPTNFFNTSLNKEDVSYYFDLLVDNEIDATLIKPVEATVEQEIKGVYTSNFGDSAKKEDC